MATSFLSPGDVSTIHRAEADGFATLIALDPFVLTLYRFDKNTGQYEARPAQTVVRTYISRRAQQDAVSETAEVTTQEGTFEKDLPFDVVLGDRFTFPGGQDGVITLVPDASGPTLTASFLVDEGRST